MVKGLFGIILGVFSVSAYSGQQMKTLNLVDEKGGAIENVVITYPIDNQVLPRPTPVIMDQVNKRFLPEVLVVEKDQRVSFPNSDNIRHHVYSFSKAKPFEIKMFKGGEAKLVTFDNAGLVILGCNIHDSMVGYIYVVDDMAYEISSASGRVQIPSNVTQITLWHPRLAADSLRQMTVELQQSPEQTLSLALLPEKKASPSRTFGSRKFN